MNIVECFKDDPLRGAEYCGGITRISIQWNAMFPDHASPDEAGNRARWAAHFANKYFRKRAAMRAARTRWGIR